MVAGAGIEPATQGFSVLHTNDYLLSIYDNKYAVAKQLFTSLESLLN